MGDTIASRCTEVETGARNVDHIIRGTLMPQLSEEVLGHIGGDGLPDKIDVIFKDGRFSIAEAKAKPKAKAKAKPKAKPKKK